MAADSRKNAIFRERYWAGDTADAPSDGEFFIDSSNTNRITVFRGGSWVTPQFDTTTLTGTTTVTTLTSTTINNSGVVTGGGVTVASTLTARGVRVILGEAHVPTAAASLLGLIQIGAVTGGATAPLNTGVPTTNSVYFTFDTGARSFAVNVAGSWFKGASLALY